MLKAPNKRSNLIPLKRNTGSSAVFPNFADYCIIHVEIDFLTKSQCHVFETGFKQSCFFSSNKWNNLHNDWSSGHILEYHEPTLDRVHLQEPDLDARKINLTQCLSRCGCYGNQISTSSGSTKLFPVFLIF